MVRGNWQKRVERTQARRKETKQRKLRKDKRAEYKNLVQGQLLPYLDKNDKDFLSETTVQREHFMHLWIDVLPSSTSTNQSNTNTLNPNYYLDDDGDEDYDSDAQQKRRGKRSNPKKDFSKHPDENEIMSSSTGTQSRSKSDRKYSDSDLNLNTSIKKIHPNSRKQRKNSDADMQQNNDSEDILLCTSHFFTGCCNHFSDAKNTYCPYYHYNKNKGQSSLADILHSNSGVLKGTDTYDKHSIDNLLKKTSQAAISAYTELEDDEYEDQLEAIDMLYYKRISCSNLDSESNIKECTDAKTSQKKLSETLNQYLQRAKCPLASIVYFAIDDKLLYDRYNGGIISNETMTSDQVSNRKMSFNDISKTPTKLSQQSNGDISLHSLSVDLIETILSFLPDEYTGILPRVCKELHHTSKSYSPGLWGLLLTRHGWLDVEGEFKLYPSLPSFSSPADFQERFLRHYAVFRDLESIKNAYTQNNITPRNNFGVKCKLQGTWQADDVLLLPWDDTGVLILNKADCTLRLFQLIKNGESSACKQTVCARIAPFPESKKLRCSLLTADVDDVYVASIIRYEDGEWISLISKQDFLTQFGGSSHQVEYDESVLLNFFIPDLFSDYYHNGQPFMGRMPEIFIEHLTSNLPFSIFINGKIHACGKGCVSFLVEFKTLDHNQEVLHLADALITFSSSHASIVSLVYIPMEISRTGLLLSSFRQRKSGRARTFLTVASKSPELLFFSFCQRTMMLDYINIPFDVSLPERVIANMRRHIIMTSTDIVIADDVHDVSSNVLSLFFIDYNSFISDSNILKNENVCIRGVKPYGSGGFHVISMHRLSGNHIILHSKDVIVAIDTLRPEEIHRISMPSSKQLQVMCCNSEISDTIAALDTECTFIMTSSELRTPHMGNLMKSENNATKKNVKKKKTPKKNMKKDGFARGMSLRG